MLLKINNILKYSFVLILFAFTLPSATMAKNNHGHSTKTTFENRADFARTMYPYAKMVSKEIGVDARVLVAQVAHETAWGKRIPSFKNGTSSYNLFGMRNMGKKTKKEIKAHTKEFVNGKVHREVAAFRAYDNYHESFLDYIRLISNAKRYKSAVDSAHSPYDYLKGLQTGGYATDPSYAKKIFAVFKSKAIQSLA